MFCTTENAVISVYVNQEEADLSLQYILGLMRDIQERFSLERQGKQTALPECPGSPQPRARPHPSPTR